MEIDEGVIRRGRLPQAFVGNFSFPFNHGSTNVRQ